MKIKQSRGTALITGGSKRLGAVMATELAKMGYDIVIHYNISSKDAKILQKNIKEIGVECSLVQADLLDSMQVYEMVKKMRKNFKNWNLLINNASIFSRSNFVGSSVEELRTNMALHLEVPMILSKEFYANCISREVRGNVINMIDKNIVRYDTKYFAYLMSKKALAEFTKVAAMELAPQVRINGIAPGFILNSVNGAGKEDESEKIIARIPLQKKGDEKNIIQALQYLLANDFVTGQIMFVDGGASLNHAG